MKLSVYVPKELESRLLEEAQERSVSPSRLVQALVQERFSGKRRQFSPRFAALAGSWEDDRSSEEICLDLEEKRQNASRSVLR